MSPLLDIQRRLVELGRIRIGVQETKNGKSRPVKLETFRFTTAARSRADAVAKLFGGSVRPWSPDGARQEYEVISPVNEIPVVVPPGPAVLSQWYELWSGGGCQRRCDGVTNVLGDKPCECPSDPKERSQLAAAGRACKPTTRISLILRDLPGVGVWRLESHGYYAATELAGSAEFLATAAAAGAPLPATLRLEQRSKREGGKTIRYAVPVLDVGATPAELLAGNVPALPSQTHDEEPPQLESVPASNDAARGYLFRIAAASSLDALRGIWIDAKATGALSTELPDENGELVPLEGFFDARRQELEQ